MTDGLVRTWYEKTDKSRAWSIWREDEFWDLYAEEI